MPLRRKIVANCCKISLYGAVFSFAVESDLHLTLFLEPAHNPSVTYSHRSFSTPLKSMSKMLCKFRRQWLELWTVLPEIILRGECSLPINTTVPNCAIHEETRSPQ